MGRDELRRQMIDLQSRGLKWLFAWDGPLHPETLVQIPWEKWLGAMPYNPTPLRSRPGSRV